MRLLLDTHVFLWIFLDRDKLSADARARIVEPANEIWLSPITTWECLVLAEKGRLELPPDPDTWVRQRIRELGPQEARLNHEVALVSRRVTFAHDDPADRFLAATAIVYDLVLLTADQRLLTSREFATLPAG